MKTIKLTKKEASILRDILVEEFSRLGKYKHNIFTDQKKLETYTITVKRIFDNLV